MNPALRIVCTGNWECQHTTEAWLSRERLECLGKPYALSELLKAARRLLDRPDTESKNR
jgi:hypothetical protein